MIKISMRTFARNAAEYMERVKKGEAFVITKRNEPIAEIVPHKKPAKAKRWSMQRPTLKIEGLSMSEEFIKMRNEERS